MNLDKLLRKIEKNKETENVVTTHPLTIGGETYEVKTMTRAEKRDFIYCQEASSKNQTAGDVVKKMKKFVYNSLNLKTLAVKAKEAGYIASYYDVVEALFEPEEILEIIGFIAEINNIGKTDVQEGLEEVKSNRGGYKPPLMLILFRKRL